MQTNQIHERISHLEFPFGKQKLVLEVWGFAWGPWQRAMQMFENDSHLSCKPL